MREFIISQTCNTVSLKIRTVGINMNNLFSKKKTVEKLLGLENDGRIKHHGMKMTENKNAN